MLGLRVVRRSGQHPTWIESTGRATVLYAFLAFPIEWPAVSGLVLLVLVATTLGSPSGRGIHDRVAGTRVVQLPR